LAQDHGRYVFVDERSDGAPTAADGVGVAVAREASGVEVQRDQLFRVDIAVAGVAHGLQRKPVVGGLYALYIHGIPRDHPSSPSLKRPTNLSAALQQRAHIVSVGLTPGHVGKTAPPKM
jgi:hypothetical protein